MAIQVRHSQQIKGFIYKTIEEKISLYADDTLLYLADPYNSFDTVLDIIESFGTFSGLQINWEKSIIFPLDDQVPVMADPECTLKIANTFKYLGITIHKEPAQFFAHNLHPLQNKFEDTLKFWTILPLTLIGRIDICKMIFLPKFLYQFTNTPCHIPKKALLEIDRTQSAFIWGNKSPTLSRSTLNAPQEQLGLASPNYELYYLAAQCAHIANWKVFDPENPASILEALYFTSVESLHNALYRSRKDISPLPPVLDATKKAWDSMAQLIHEIRATSPDTPLWGNLTHFASFLEAGTWAKLGIKRMDHLYSNGELHTLPQLQQITPRPGLSDLRYAQIVSLCRVQFPQQPQKTILGPGTFDNTAK
uniref:Reverse transcriptase domain-containing protein n=1 Tax=Xenopus tropicalis TaxID=8364 RepID=A0A803K4F0_XENTR